MRSRFWTKKKRLWIFWTKKNGLSRFSRIFELFELTPTPIPPLFISDLPTTLLNFIQGNSCLRPEKSVISEKLSKNTFAVRLFELFSNSYRFEFRPYYNFFDFEFDKSKLFANSKWKLYSQPDSIFDCLAAGFSGSSRGLGVHTPSPSCA